MTILIEKGKNTSVELTHEAVSRAVSRHLEEGLSRMEAMKAAAREFGVAKGVVYRYLSETRSAVAPS
jgi:transposase